MNLSNQNSDILVSVIIPVYNAERYIEECLRSIINQTLKRIEIFCVDDGSTDSSLSILESFARKDRRITVLKSKNKGAGAARNIALKLAKGQYLSILDADDIFHKNMLEKSYNQAIKTNADVVIFQHNKIDDETGDISVIPSLTDPKRYPSTEAFTMDDFSKINQNWFYVIPGWTWDKLFKRTFVESNNIQFQSTMIYNDMYFTYAALSSATRVSYIPEILMSQRINHKGRLSGKIQEGWHCIIQSLGSVKDYLCSIGAYEKWKTIFSTYALHMLVYTFERTGGEEREKARFAFGCYALRRLGLDLSLRQFLMYDCDVEFAKREWLLTACSAPSDKAQLLMTPKAKKLNLQDFKNLMHNILNSESWKMFEDEYESRYVSGCGQNYSVSVIIPVYNVETTLRAALDSVLHQTLPNIEIICVNDGSSDSSAIILAEYVQKHENIRVLTFAKNQGLMMAMKVGALYSVGKYITVLESDDELTANACEEMFLCAQRTSADLIQGRTIVQNPNNLPQERIDVVVKLLTPYEKTSKGHDILRRTFVERRYPTNVCGKLYARELMQNAFLHLQDVHTFMASDTLTFFVIAALANKCETIQSNVYVYNYGLGITGRSRLSFDDFSKQCGQIDILPPLKRFAEGWKYIEEAYAVLEKKMLNEAYGRIQAFLYGEELQKKGLTLLLQKMGGEKFVEFFADKFFNDQNALISLFSRLSFFDRTATKDVRKIGIYYYHMTYGGVQRVLSILMPLFLKMGYEICVILDTPLDNGGFKLPSGVKVCYLPPSAKVAKDNIKERINSLVNIIHEEKIDLLYYNAYSSQTFLWDLMACKIVANIPFVVHHHTCAAFRLTWNRNSQAFSNHSKLMSFVDCLITLSKADELYFKSLGVNAIYMPNPIEKSLENEFLNLIPRSIENSEPPFVLWCARISHEKQVFDAVRIFMRVHELMPDVRLKIVGDGDPKIVGELSRFIKRSGLADVVSLEGGKADTYSYYREASLFLSTSGIEGFGMTLLEAMCFAVPIVAYPIPYLELMQDNEGVCFVEPQAFDEAAATICAILTDTELVARMREAEKGKVQEILKYDHKNAWRDIFNSVQTGELLYSKEEKVGLHSIGVVIREIEQCWNFGFRLEYLSAGGKDAAKGRVIQQLVDRNEKAPIGNSQYIDRKFFLEQTTYYENGEWYFKPWRLTMLFVWFDRKIHGLVQCYMDNGLKYTIKHFIKKCKRRH